MSNIVHIPLAQGTRVRVIATHRPPPPHDRGIIWKHEPEHGGYLVQHDSSPWPTDGLPGETTCLFGWAYSEIEVEEPAVADPHPAGPPAGRLPGRPRNAP